MTNELNNNPIAYDDLDARLTAIFNRLPAIFSDHLDYLIDDFHADPACYLSSIPRLANLDLESLIYPTRDNELSIDQYRALTDDARAQYIAEHDALIRTNFDTLMITDTDLLAMITCELIDHECDHDDDDE